ncbi:MAG: carbohydrate-binding protein [Betaproteobacteria bacterium]|nr:carbohydrate-binding protein [Betaproteobacteria bacterium]
MSPLERLLPQAPRALCRMLDPAAGTVAPPVRSEVFGPERFAQHGRSLGETHTAAPARLPGAGFFPRLRDNIRMLRQAQRYIAAQAATGYDVSPAAEWLLDNFHLIETQLDAIHEGLPRSYFRRLPVLRDEPLAGLPRVYGVAWAFVAHTDSAFDETLLVHFVAAYQHSRELQLGEMWALPTTLRVVLVENLRRLAERVAAQKAAREAANLCCDEIAQWTGPALAELHTLIAARGVGTAFVAQVMQRLQDRGVGGGARAEARFPASVQAWLQALRPELPALQLQQGVDQTADNLSVSNAVTSLRAINDTDWPDIVARSSPLMRLMLAAPLFAAEHTGTRDQTLHGIEALARRSRRSEVAVAQTLLALMATAPAGSEPPPDGARRGIAAHWLQGSGRPALAHALGLHEGLLPPLRAALQRAALPLYLSAVLGGSVGLVAWMLQRQGAPPAGAWGVLMVLLMLLPASEAVGAVIHRLIGESARPRCLPRLALADGIPDTHRVMVVMPAMLTSAAGTARLAHRLQLHALANPELNAQFALLTDWADAAATRADGDEDLLADALQHVERLNAGAPTAPGVPPRFLLLHRRRVFCTTEDCWLGWERKRGKLEQLLAALAGEPGAAFVDLGALSHLAPGTTYLLTLDSDTQLPPGALRELVGVAAHPSNTPQLSADGRRVQRGYGILQPHLVMPLPTAQERTPYHWLFAGQCGIDPYSAASSEVYQDVFGEGSYTGKGLMHVQAVHAVLGGRLPAERILSHDLLEGALARCAAVSDVSLIEEAPFHADVAASRLHRWTRGDWQLLPFLLQPRRYAMRGVNRWKMVDNLRRSLVAPASLALLVGVLAGGPGSGGLAPLNAVLLVLAAFGAGPLMGAVAGFAPSRDRLALWHFYRAAGIDGARTVLGALWHGALLLQHALLATDALARTLWRLLFSRRHLLQWTTAAEAQAAAQTTLAGTWHQHRSVPLVALAIAAALLLHTPAPLAWTLVLCALWASAPLLTWWVSRPRPGAGGTALAGEDAARLHAVARDTWRYFERTVTAADHHLPPDNLQTTPHEMLARRTSPTNIGLYLLSAACARAFGWTGTPELLQRLEATLATLQGMPRHRGHFLNWYDTETALPLLPMYVSTVDSGNLSGHLLAVAAACREFAEAPDEADHAARLRTAAAHCEQLAWAPDFNFLYHRKRHLLHIGYRVAEQQLDASFYDLLASESRLTSLLAIAKGDVPVAHWAALGRPFYAVGARAGLRSWSGSMFEYLMPTLVLAEPRGSVLHDATHAALHEQQAWARTQGVPWGISESAHAGCDHTLAYQYAPQGAPRLALRRTPPDELVIAPYATALAAQIDAPAACRNLASLDGLAARGRYGYIEALDFTPARQTGGLRVTPVDTYMAHHQGMSIVALANVLLGGVAQRWGMGNPRIEALGSLLHERAPREVPVLPAPPAPLPASGTPRAPSLQRQVLPGEQAVEPTQLLSNGRYHVALRANGAGHSRRGTVGITRWRDDALRDAHGSFFYLRHLAAQGSATAAVPGTEAAPWVSLSQHPAPDPAATYTAVFHADRVCLDADWPGLHTHVTVWLSPEDDIEFRQVELRNTGAQTLELELVSTFEVTLADARADEAHPAFGNLFVRAEWRPAAQAMVFERTPRLAGERGLHMAHFLADADAGANAGATAGASTSVVAMSGQTDRAKWLGRNHTAAQPLGLLAALPAQLQPGATGPLPAGPDALALDTGLDPVCALGVRLRIAPGGHARLTFATAACDDDATLHAVVDKYRQPGHVERALLMSTTLAGIRLRALRIGADELAAIQLLSTALLLGLTRLQATTSDEPVDRRLLWRLGLSGERPLLLVLAGAVHGMGLLRSLARALPLWAGAGLACDLVVVNAEPAGYQMALQRDIAALRDRHEADSAALPEAERVGLFLLRADELSAAELATLHGLARVVLQADGRPLLHHVHAWAAAHDEALQAREGVAGVAPGLVQAGGVAAVAVAAAGHFSADGREFGFGVHAGARPPKPWINVLANPGFGSLVSEAGGGCTWAGNSRMNQLTAWSNDAVADTPSESFWLQDLRSLETWNLAPGAIGDARVRYDVQHGQGQTRIGHRRGDLEVEASWCVDPVLAIKQVRLRVRNLGRRTQRLRVTALAEWMMGAARADRHTVHTARHRRRLDGAAARELLVLTATQREQAGGFGSGTAFLALAGAPELLHDWTCDRREAYDARGRPLLPDHWLQTTGSGLDPMAAMSTTLMLGAGEEGSCCFLLGHADDAAAARALAAAAAQVAPAARLQAVKAQWDELLGATTVATPDPLFDALVNRWLLYQAVACRLWAKAAFYQAGGATGYRDQLQDTLALSWAAPDLLRAQIVLCASRQFTEGDVQHWWHAPGGAGVRTHFSDDLLWLPYAVLHYLRATDDTALLDEDVPFIEGQVIAEGAEDSYGTPQVSAETATVYEHAARSIDRSLRSGAHGLPLMGSGDWNDGMNRVGAEGRGESVWLAWFLCTLVSGYAPLARTRGEVARARRWEDAAADWQAALVGTGLRPGGTAWDGAWFTRAYFDDGSPLGSQHNAEARIDLIAQAWAVLSGVAPAGLARQAMASAQTHLADPAAGVLRLLHPPLAHAEPSAGYIQAYPRGVRENGGQYTHAGVWGVMAMAQLSQAADSTPAEAAAAADTAWQWFTWLSPAHRSAHPTQGPAYGLEPYAVAGDTYSQAPWAGRGGWSWYTGAASWLHRAAVESVFGLRLRAAALSLHPALPSHWRRAELTLRRDGRKLRFVLLRPGFVDTLLEARSLREAGAKALAVGEALAWPALQGEHVFVLMLHEEREADAAALARAWGPAAPQGAAPASWYAA